MSVLSGARPAGLVAVAGFGLAAALPFLPVSAYGLHVAILTAIFIVLVQSLNLVLGYCGLLSLATPAFFGMGAYTSALLAMRLDANAPVCFATAGIVGAVTGIVLGIPSLRLSRHSFVIVTLSFALLLQLVANNWGDLTRGAMGLSAIPAPRLFGATLESKAAWLWTGLIAALSAIAFVHLVASSRVGRGLVAVRDDEALAAAVGLDVLRLRIFAFSSSGLLAGVAGALYAHYITYVDPGVFGFELSETLLIMVILGGAGTLWGPVAGAVVFSILPEALRLAPEIRSLLYGVLLLGVVIVLPKGVLSLRHLRPRLPAWIRSR